MKLTLPADVLERCAKLIEENLGLLFPPQRWLDLERGLRAALITLDTSDNDFLAAARHLADNPLSHSKREALVKALTVGETYFWREPKTLDALSERILPELIARRAASERHLRFWSAGCCTGEEAYTIAIMVDRLLPHRHDWRIDILGTDANPDFLKKARAGIYSDWSFRDAPTWLRENYFRPVGAKQYALLPKIRAMARFSRLNLVEPVYPHLENGTAAVDLILCRNVLMYFAPEQAAAVCSRFNYALSDGGWLAVSATETSAKNFSPLRSIRIGEAFLYQKREKLPAIDDHRVTTESRSRLGSEARDAEPFASQRPPPLPAEPFVARPANPETKPANKRQVSEARSRFRLGDYAGAAAAWREAPPTEPTDLTDFARCCANLGSLDEARKWIVAALAREKTDAALHYLHAVILEELGTVSEAVKALKRVLYLDPQFILAHYSLGNLAARSQRYDEASRHFQNALDLLHRLEPDEVVPYSDHLSARRLRVLIAARLGEKIIA